MTRGAVAPAVNGLETEPMRTMVVSPGGGPVVEVGAAAAGGLDSAARPDHAEGDA